jgi:phosphopantothenoylcysteine decarboxylase/phosphopantothenate--cysteine ligase
VQNLLTSSQSLAGRRVVVTAGRTEQPIDPVRFITNRSTGKMGYALAEQAQRRGADVVLISGPSTLTVPAGVAHVPIRSVADLKTATESSFENADALIMTAAVLDFRPDQISKVKLKKVPEGLDLHLVPNEDFLVELGKHKGSRKVIGFAMETDNASENARGKLQRKHLDLIALNELNVEGAGFGVDTNVVTLFSADGQETALPLMSKHAVADRILDWLEAQWA